MDFHTDGTYVKEITDWLLMTKIEEKHVKGGEGVILHLDDWEYLDELYENPIRKKILCGDFHKVKIMNIKCNTLCYLKMKRKDLKLHIDQFPEPKNMVQGIFLQKLPDNFEESENKVIIKLPVGSSIIVNNYFWFHGRKTLLENNELSRDLLRIGGSFSSK